MSDRRFTYWTRWPDETNGPLWVGTHYNERSGSVQMVGIETWTEPPGTARSSLGPEAPPIEDILPWAPVPLTSRHLLGLRLPALFGRFLRNLPEDDPLRSSTRPRKAGGAPTHQVDHYERVAAVWHQARAQGRHDTDKAVAETFHVSRPTASVWTRKARTLGLLDGA